MPDYSFASLSPYEFEHLVRDLLQAEQGTVYESFTPGPDGGYDARWIDRSSGTTVVQCKHYLQTGYARLLSALTKEAPRVHTLSPARYIVATSLGLTPGNKDAIWRLFAPCCQSPADVLGRDDLNNRLGLFPQVEQRHIKLWLTSDAVLARALEARIFGASAMTLDRARRKAERYVMNPSYERAIALLETRHVCIIAGIPGIGKTTLAEVLLTHYADRRGFQPFRITRDLAELDGLRRRNQPQVFYYDDFLGTTGLDSLGKNEDRRLVEFMQEVAETPSWRLVLTTREYILAAAQSRYEALALAQFDHTTCVISLKDYTKSVRAEILYNHLYFSDLPSGFREALLPARAYRRVYAHPHYNPRIIEAMTSAAHVTADTPAAYAVEFVAALDDPGRIWRHAYENQLTAAARNLLLVRGSLPRGAVFLEDLRTAFIAFHEFRQSRYGYTISDTDFRAALRALDGTFLRTYRDYKNVVVEFHNPSVQDFVERRLDAEPLDVRDLALGAAFFDQFRLLFRGRGSDYLAGANEATAAALGLRARVPYPGVKEHADAFLDGLERLIEGPSCLLARYRSAYRDARWWRSPPAFEDRVTFALDVGKYLNTPRAARLVGTILDRLAARLHGGQCDDRDQLVRILLSIDAGDAIGQRSDGPAYVAGKRFLTTQLDSLEDYAALTAFIRFQPGSVSDAGIARIRAGFMDSRNELMREPLNASEPDDADWVKGAAEQLGDIGEVLGLDLTECIAELEQHAEQLEGPEPDEDDWRGTRSISTADHGLSEAQIDQMFDSLRGGEEEPSG